MFRGWTSLSVPWSCSEAGLSLLCRSLPASLPTTFPRGRRRETPYSSPGLCLKINHSWKSRWGYLQGHVHVLVNRNETLWVIIQVNIRIAFLLVICLQKYSKRTLVTNNMLIVSFENDTGLHSQHVEPSFFRPLGLLFLLFAWPEIILLQILQ